MDLGLKNKVAVVAASTRGLGFAIAKMFGEEGAKVVVNGRNEATVDNAVKKITKATKAEVIGIVSDVSTSEGCQKFIAEAENAFGGIDILITNAGGPAAGILEVLDEETWYKGFELSFMTHVRLIKNALPALRGSDSPSVITITSLSAKQPIKNMVISNSMRAGALGLTKTLSLELGEEGIRFNSLLPGWTFTERVTELMTGRANANGTTVEEEATKQAAESPFKRMATPEEFASATVFLASPRAKYITGINLSVDGGMIKSTF